MINVTTPNGGTMRNSVDLMDDLDDWGLPNQRIEKDTVSVEELKSVGITSIFTTLGHSEVINPFFKFSLMSSGLQKLD